MSLEEGGVTLLSTEELELDLLLEDGKRVGTRGLRSGRMGEYAREREDQTWVAPSGD